MPVLELGDSGPHGLVGSPEHLEDVQQLLNLGLAREHGRLSDELREDAPDGPHVHRGGVQRGSQEDLRGAVPQRDDLVGVGLERNAERPAQSEVRDLELELAPVHEEVLGLEVPVQHAVLVAVRNSLDEVEHEPLHDIHWHGSGVWTLTREVHVLLQVRVQVLEHQVKDGLAVLLDLLHRKQLDDVVALGQHVQQRDLAKGGARHSLFLHLQPRLLQRDHAPVPQVLGPVHLSVGALADLLQLHVVIHRLSLSLSSTCSAVCQCEWGLQVCLVWGGNVERLILG